MEKLEETIVAVLTDWLHPDNGPPTASGILAMADEIGHRAREAGMVREWEPIETAPKDGTQFLAMLSNGWYSLLRARSTDRYSHWVGSGETPPIVETHPADTDWEKTYTILATHWMPLPAPPLPEGTEK